ncbi:MAG TPA: flagellar basal body P-ring formation chaperone FlgA [Rhizobacter sp.]|nr:flagellar basal body P-ring formation chaperone FlgA [Rhizobacter sp.]
MKKTLCLLRAVSLGWLSALAGSAFAQASTDPLADMLVNEARRFVQAKVAEAGLPRTEVVAGQPDARLRLAPCNQLKAYLPNGARLWGKTRVGLRCEKGVTLWNVYLPMTVKVFGQALVASSALPVGHVLAENDFHQAEVNLAEDLVNPPLTDASAVLGRTLGKAVSPGQGLRASNLKARQWFAPGDPVQIRVAGDGFAVAGSGQAVTAGMEGQVARVRTESGRVVSGKPVAERQLEIAL